MGSADPPITFTLLLRHMPTALAVAAFWLSMQFIFADMLFAVVLGSKKYAAMSADAKENLREKLVSTLSAVLLSFSSVYLAATSQPLRADHVWGYDYRAELVVIWSVGYFLWDLVVCVRMYHKHGWQFLCH